METTSTFGQWLKQRRHELDLTQEAVAEAANCSIETIRKIESGQRRPSRQMAELLADHLHVDPRLRPAFVLWARGASDAPTFDALTAEERKPQAPAASAVPSRPTLTFALKASSSLPVLLTPLVGRERELAYVRAMLWHSSTRLLTLLGPPGIGKTTLATAVASSLQADFKDGLVYVPLGPVADPVLVAAAIGEGLGVRETPDRPLLDSLQDVLRDKQMLLILDNFEHVVPAAPLLTRLLTAAPQLKILVTSRSALHLRGEKLVEVPPLEMPDPQRLPPLEELARIGSVALFVDRVRDARGDFDLAPQNAPLTAAICARLDGLPLAIELAAAKTRILSLQALLSRMERQLALLTGGPRDAPLHQQTLRGSLESSYALLSPDEQQLFRRLGIFAGSFTFEGAERVAEATLDNLEAILDQSLLHLLRQPPLKMGGLGGVSPQNPPLFSLAVEARRGMTTQMRDTERTGGAERLGDGGEADARFAMLTPVREFAVEQLDAAQERADVSLKHARYLLDLALTAESEINGPNQKLWLDRLDAEYNDIRAALDWSLKNEQPEIALRLAGAMLNFWLTKGYRQEGRRWLEQALTEGEGAPATARIASLRALGILSHRQGERGEAKRYLSEAVALGREVGEGSLIVKSLPHLAWVLTEMGEYERATRFLHESLEISRGLGDRFAIARTLQGLASVAYNQGDFTQALTWYEEALVVRRQLGVPIEIAVNLQNLAVIALKQGDYQRAITYGEECTAINAEVGNKEALAYGLGVVGKAALKLCDYERAAANFAKSLSLFVELGGASRMAAFALEEIGRVAIRIGEPAKAARLFGAAERLRESTNAAIASNDRTEYDEGLAAMRQALGEARLAAAWAVGRSMSQEETVSYASSLFVDA